MRCDVAQLLPPCQPLSRQHLMPSPSTFVCSNHLRSTAKGVQRRVAHRGAGGVRRCGRDLRGDAHALLPDLVRQKHDMKTPRSSMCLQLTLYVSARYHVDCIFAHEHAMRATLLRCPICRDTTTYQRQVRQVRRDIAQKDYAAKEAVKQEARAKALAEKHAAMVDEEEEEEDDDDEQEEEEEEEDDDDNDDDDGVEDEGGGEEAEEGAGAEGCKAGASPKRARRGL